MAGLKRCLSALALLSLVTESRLVEAQQSLAVVLASTAPGYAIGQVLATSDVAIPDGASTVFLLPSGQLITVKGPYSGLLRDQLSTARQQELAQLLVPGQDRSEIGGSRSIEPGPHLGQA